MELYPKFIILDDMLIISKVKYHKDILCDEVDPIKDKHRIKGGGWFKFVNITNTFVFSNESHDFGKATLEDIQKAVTEGKVFTNIYQTHSIADKHNFAYDTGTETIMLKTLENGTNN